jgi:hypothetical protein
MSNEKPLYQVVAKYIFDDGGGPEYSTPLFIGSQEDCDKKARTLVPPGHGGGRPSTGKAELIVMKVPPTDGEITGYMESYRNADDLLPPSADGCERIEKHLTKIGHPARVAIEDGLYVAEVDGKRETLQIGPREQS